MTNAISPYLDQFAELLEYPSAGYFERLRLARIAASKVNGTIGEKLLEYGKQLEGLRDQDLEELYTRTFDINPDVALELGWHLYGENYSRGDFLVKMRGFMRSVGVEETPELPDHISSVLRCLARMDRDSAVKLVVAEVLPALNKMLDGFGEKQTPYKILISAVDDMVRNEFVSSKKGRVS